MSDESRLVNAFERILATRMAGVPLVNDALHVEAVGFRDWQQRRVGVLVTPWAINLVVLQGDGGPLARLAPDARRHWDFPSGRYEFMGGEEAGCGVFDFCSLFSPAQEFADQGEARAVALETMTQLFSAATPAAGARLTRRALLTMPEA